MFDDVARVVQKVVHPCSRLFQECVICRKKTHLSELRQPKNQDSWTTVVDAIRIHCCEHIISLEEADIAILHYHHDCKSNYTLFSTLNHVLSQKQGESCPFTANLENNFEKINKEWSA